MEPEPLTILQFRRKGVHCGFRGKRTKGLSNERKTRVVFGILLEKAKQEHSCLDAPSMTH